MHYAEFVRAQQDSFIRGFFQDPGTCLIVTPSIDKLLAVRRNSNWRPLGATDPANAFVYSGSDGDELWVRPFNKDTGNGSYRRHWAQFVAQQGVDVQSGVVDGRQQHVDHLLPETFAAARGFSHVRVLAVDSRSNTTVGSTIERSMTQRVNPGKSLLADWFSVAKAACFLGSFRRDLPAAQVMAELRKHLATRGFVITSAMEPTVAHSMQAILDWSRA
jgi:hypothetical protein